MKITFFGQSAFLIETADHSLIVDPFLSGNPLCDVDPAAIKADYVLLTHGHADHFGDTVQIAKANGATVIGNFEIAQYCGTLGLEAHPMHIGGAFNFPFGRIKLTMAMHGSSIAGADGLPIYLGEPAGLLLFLEGKTILHAGDTGLFMDMQLIGERNAIDLAILPVGDNFTMGPEDAVKAVEFLKPKAVVPCHYNTFPPIELTTDQLDVFDQEVRALGAAPHRLQPGDTLEL